ncbi:hypothetical protein GCM10027088_67000 [Nocardia goodfellowii]
MELERLSGPVEEIAERELLRAVWKWGSTFDGGGEWMRWVAPRLLRWVGEDGAWIDGELVGCRLFAAGWREWAEAGVIEKFCEALWRETLAGSDRSVPVVLSFLVSLTDAVEPWLDVWSRTSGAAADRHFRELWREWGQQLLGGRLEVCCYREGPNIAPVLADWVIAEAPRRIRDGDLDEVSAWMLEQLPLPPDRRWS